MNGLIKSATARQVGDKWEITAHFEDGTSEVILKRGANRGLVQQYQFHEHGRMVSLPMVGENGYWVSFGKTIASDVREYHLRTIPVEAA
jgi:hypothetical protein